MRDSTAGDRDACIWIHNALSSELSKHLQPKLPSQASLLRYLSRIEVSMLRRKRCGRAFRLIRSSTVQMTQKVSTYGNGLQKNAWQWKGENMKENELAVTEPATKTTHATCFSQKRGRDAQYRSTKWRYGQLCLFQCARPAKKSNEISCLTDLKGGFVPKLRRLVDPYRQASANRVGTDPFSYDEQQRDAVSKSQDQ